jgi:hypothetical protein
LPAQVKIKKSAEKKIPKLKKQLDKGPRICDNFSMNLLDNVRNGEFFCLKNNPTKIYKRIHDLVVQKGIYKHVVYIREVHMVGKTHTSILIKLPHKLEVIPLGELSDR